MQQKQDYQEANEVPNKQEVALMHDTFANRQSPIDCQEISNQHTPRFEHKMDNSVKFTQPQPPETSSVYESLNEDKKAINADCTDMEMKTYINQSFKWEKLSQNSPPSNSPLLQRMFGPLKPGALRGSIFTITSSAMGGSLLTIPLILIKSAHITEKYTYPQAVEAIFGKKARNLLLIVISVYLMGTLVSYFIIIGSMMPDIFKQIYSGIKISRIPCILIFFVIAASLSFFRQMAKLRHFTILGPVSLIYASLVLIGEMPLCVKNNSYDDLQYFKFDIKIFQSVSLMLFSFICHSNLFRVQGELERSDVRRMGKVMKRSLRVLIVFYILIGVVGYLCFIEDMPKLFTERKKPQGLKHDFLMEIAKVLIILIVTLKIPLNVSPCRDAIFVLLSTSAEKAKLPLFLILTAAILLSTLSLALALPDIVPVLSILGGSFGVTHAFIFPCLMEFKLSKEFGKLYSWNNLKIGLITLTMTILGFGNVIITIIHAFS